MAKILIAEDERDIRDLITFTLRFAGHEVVATVERVGPGVRRRRVGERVGNREHVCSSRWTRRHGARGCACGRVACACHRSRAPVGRGRAI